MGSMNRIRASRRDFLRWSAGGAFAAGAFQALGSGKLLHAAAMSPNANYRALVVFYLAGGNDSFNLVVPTSAGAYGDYADARQGMAVPLNDLLGITPATPDGNTYGFHPSAAGLRTLFEDGKLAVVANAGTMVAPMSKGQYLDGSVARPPRLFSHNDQQSQSMRVAADEASAIGWGGALADRLGHLNGVTSLSPGITIAGSTPLLRGQSTQAYHLGTGGSVSLKGFSGSTGSALQATFDALRAQPQAHVMQRQFAMTRGEAIELDGVVSAALDAGDDLDGQFPEGNSAASQLRMVARMIGARATLGMERQVFFVKMGGFDTHAGQLADQPVLFQRVSEALAAFQAAIDGMGAGSLVTTAVVSEFGRTLSSNGQGTDHGWGGHYLVLGGAVQGGDIYGTMPSFALDGADDGGAGRMIPTTSLDQFAATLARWFGIDPVDLPSVFPNLGSFPSSDLGFMA